MTSSSCKLLETMIRDDIIKHLEEKNLLSKEQHGFRSGHSCNTQLLEVVHDWAEAAGLLYPVDIVYLDYQKAGVEKVRKFIKKNMSNYSYYDKSFGSVYLTQ